MRGKINWTWKKITGTILGVLGIGTLVSCYGMVEDDDLSVYGTVTNSDGGKIKGIEVTLKKSSGNKTETTTTSDSGTYEFAYLSEGSYTLNFKDVDGSENGSYKEKTEEATLSYNDIEPNKVLNVTLENAD
ncbi:MAG: radical SAM-associated putative lipoprotein [Treponema sp.]|nr:radical SAM-associated putative lipoprotein [Treponema sp.]